MIALQFPRAVVSGIALAACVLILIALSACVSVPLTDPSGVGGAVVAVDPTGITYNAPAYNLFLSEGVPPSFFTATPQGYHMTNFYHHLAENIRVAHANPSK